jgi:hypothetical protein
MLDPMRVLARGIAVLAVLAVVVACSGGSQTTPPIVVGSRDGPDGAQTQGGRALQVCGLDGTGRSYKNDILFFGTADDFTAIEAVYWVIGFSESHVAAATDPSPGPEWSTCPTGVTE